MKPLKNNIITVAMLPAEILVDRLKEAKYSKDQIKNIITKAFGDGYEDDSIAVTFSMMTRGGVFVVTSTNPLYSYITKIYNKCNKGILDSISAHIFASTGKTLSEDEFNLIKASHVDDTNNNKIIRLLTKEIILQDLLSKI